MRLCCDRQSTPRQPRQQTYSVKSPRVTRDTSSSDMIWTSTESYPGQWEISTRGQRPAGAVNAACVNAAADEDVVSPLALRSAPLSIGGSGTGQFSRPLTPIPSGA